jgi:plasmid stabilization system protein ParE
MRIRYTPRARFDLEIIFRYLDQRSPAGATSVKRTIHRRIGLLADMPFIAPAVDEPSVHELTIIRYPYKVYYRVEGEDVWILHVRHTSRRPPIASEL